jgi:hypothetical protein
MGLAAVGVVSLASAARADETKMSQVQTALSNTTLSGYVDTAAQWNLGSQNGGPTTPSTGVADGFSLNAIDLALDKPQDESPWAAGYHVELMAGPGAIPGVTTTAPLGAGANSSTTAAGGLGIRQAYLALRTPVGNSAIDWKVGVWDTIIGYESSSDPSNPNYTRSYGYGIEPTTHTGILGTFKINDMFTVQAGVADGSNVNGGAAGINGVASQESQKAYMGAIAFTAPDSWGWAKGTTINAGIINADDSKGASAAPAFVGTPANQNGTTSFYAGATVPTPLTALKVGIAYDYIDYHNNTGGVDGSQSVIGFYGNYQYNDKLSFNGRFEHLETNFGGVTPAFDEFTATVQYSLWANVLSRVEFRWDHSEDHAAFDYTSYGTGTTPAGSVIHNNAYMVALNLIYQF